MLPVLTCSLSLLPPSEMDWSPNFASAAATLDPKDTCINSWWGRGATHPLLWTQIRTKPTIRTRQISPAHCIGLPPGDTLCLLGIFSVVVCDEFCHCVPMTWIMHLHRMIDEWDFKLLVINSYSKYCTCAVEFYVGGRCKRLPPEIRRDFLVEVQVACTCTSARRAV